MGLREEVGKYLEGCVVSMAFPLDYKTAVLSNELSKYCEIFVILTIVT
ncbi:hypothetical protein [Archaeoglobus sp.]